MQCYRESARPDTLAFPSLLTFVLMQVSLQHSHHLSISADMVS